MCFCQATRSIQNLCLTTLTGMIFCGMLHNFSHNKNAGYKIFSSNNSFGSTNWIQSNSPWLTVGGQGRLLVNVGAGTCWTSRGCFARGSCTVLVLWCSKTLADSGEGGQGETLTSARPAAGPKLSANLSSGTQKRALEQEPLSSTSRRFFYSVTNASWRSPDRISK